jgi:hypothetical protein
MINLNLTEEESKMTCGFLQAVLEMVQAKPHLTLLDKEHTTAVLTSIMSKLETQIEAQRVKSAFEQTIEFATKMVNQQSNNKN